MHFSKSAVSIFGAACLAAVALPVTAQADDKDVIDYRQHIMHSLDAQTAAIGEILSYAVPEDQFASHLETLAAIAQTALSAFEPKVQGGESLPAVWDKWDDFSARMKDFAEKTDAVAKHAKANGKDAVMNEIVAALACKGCHDEYREKK